MKTLPAKASAADRAATGPTVDLRPALRLAVQTWVRDRETLLAAARQEGLRLILVLEDGTESEVADDPAGW